MTNKELDLIETGKENKNTILFLHPEIVSNWIWEKQLDYFKNKKYHCIYLNLIDNKTYFSIKEYSEEVIQLIENILEDKNIKSVNIVGFGIGGKIAIEILNKKPQYINKLILSSLSLNYLTYFNDKNNDKDNDNKSNDNKNNNKDNDNKDNQITKENRINNKKSLELIYEMSKIRKEYLNNKSEKFLVKAYLRYYGISKSYYENMKHSLDLDNVKNLKNIVIESFNYRLPKDLDNKLNSYKFNTANVLLIYGSKEDLTKQISIITFKTILKDAKIIEIENGLELVNISQSKLFNNTLIEFLDK